MTEKITVLSEIEHIRCLVCNKEHNFYSFRGLSFHIIRVHKITTQQYYDRFLIKPNEGICLGGCNRQTGFYGLGRGYSGRCLNCAKSYSSKCQWTEENREIKRKETISLNKIRWAQKEFRNKHSKRLSDLLKLTNERYEAQFSIHRKSNMEKLACREDIVVSRIEMLREFSYGYHGVHSLTNIRFSSLYEAMFIHIMYLKGKLIKRSERTCSYTMNGRERLYFPDFDFEDNTYEIKGWCSEDVPLKECAFRKSFPNINYEILYYKDLMNLIELNDLKFNIEDLKKNAII
jgi:hypothetical protein